MCVKCGSYMSVECIVDFILGASGMKFMTLSLFTWFKMASQYDWM